MKGKKKTKKEVVVKELPPTTNTPFIISLILALIAWGVSLYLLKRHFQIESAAQLGDPCSAIFGKSCDETLRSPLAVRWGIPLAGWGAMYFSAILTLLLMGKKSERNAVLHPFSLAFILSIPSLVISVFLTASMFFGGSPYCPLCVIIHSANLGLFFSLRSLSETSITENLSNIARIHTAFKSILVSLVVAIAVYLLGNVIVGSSPATLPPAEKIEQSGSLYLSAQQFEIPVDESDAYSGSLDAAVQLVVFSDFQCPACRNYSAVIHQWQQEYGDKVCVVFKDFPLDRACNPIMKRDLHKEACNAAYAAEAALRQKEFWAYHDALFAANLESNPDVFETLARACGLDIKQFQSERQSSSVQSQVMADIHLGVKLGVNSTPTLFLNRRRVLDQSPELVRYLIDQTLAKN